MELVSSAFENGCRIPDIYSKKGKNIPPPLSFKDIPKNTKSLALIVEDPNGPLIKFVHWTVWNIPTDTKGILEGEKITFPQGKNSFQKTGYIGPCPPYGKHKYFFKLYALDTMLDVKPKSSKKKVEKAMSGHILQEAQLIGMFEK